MGGFSKFKTDPGLEVNGIRLEYGDGLSLTCSRAGGANKDFQRKLEEVSAPYLRAIEHKVLDAATADRLFMEAFAHTIVKSWEGVTMGDLDGSDDDEAAPCTPANIVSFFEQYPDIFTDVRTSVQEARLYRVSVDEAASGN